MKHPKPEQEHDLFGPTKRGRGRPVTGVAKSSAQRQKERRERLRDDGKAFLTVHVDATVLEGLRAYIRFKDITPDQVIEKLLRQQLLRKR
ncbi:hypothetical protein D3C87_583340 [compost metagenome]